MNRYNRHIILPEIGAQGQQKINQAKVLVIGAGGLGCPILQYLAAAGVGTLGIVDFDIVDKANLQRQILFGTSSLGKNKAIAAKQRLTDINPLININTYPEALTHKNAVALFEQYDIIVDGTDNFATRYLINDTCLLTQKPLVYGAIYKFEGQVAVFNYQNGPSYRCLFPTPPKDGSVKPCSEIGVLGVLPGIIGTLQANEVLKIILGIGNVLSGKLQCYDALTTQLYTLDLQRNDAEIKAVLAKRAIFSTQKDTVFECKTEVREISIEEALKLTNGVFIDIRESYEKPEINQLPVVKIPLSTLEQNLTSLDTEKNIILFCQSGLQSINAIKILEKYHINKSYSLQGGALAIENYYKLIKL